MKKKVAIAVSGGIDSLMAAYFLKQAGHDIFGLHFITGYEKKSFDTIQREMDFIAAQINADVHLLDLSRSFTQGVVSDFIHAYMQGQTPNPCMRCNAAIKFGILLDEALKMGASHLATGHYARIRSLGEKTVAPLTLLKGLDAQKDQSYFLAMVPSSNLPKIYFPLGEYKKKDIIAYARQKGLSSVTSSESQDICFTKDQSYAQFIANQKGFTPTPGPIVDTQGIRIGTHNGLHLYTFGQRRGINCPAPSPYYVVHIDMPNNRLIVGHKADLLNDTCKVTHINWIAPMPIAPISVQTRIRYRHQAAESILTPMDQETAMIRFKTPQTSITPGQGAVFYQKDIVLGGGWIEASQA